MTQSTRNLSPLLAIAFFALAGFFPASSLFAAAPFNPGYYILGFQEAALTSGEKTSLNGWFAAQPKILGI